MDTYEDRFKVLTIDEQKKVTRIIEAIGRGEVAQKSDYNLSPNAIFLVIDIIKEQVLRV